MADFLLSVGVDVGLSYDQMQKDISTLVSQLNGNPPKIKVALDIDSATINQLRTQISDISKTLQSNSSVNVSATGASKVAADMSNVATNARNAANATRTANTEFKQTDKEVKKLTFDSKEYYAALKQIQTLLIQVTNNQEKWTAAKNGKSSGAYSDLSTYAVKLTNLISQVQSGAMSVDDFNKRMAELSSKVATANSTIKAAGENTQTWAQRVGNLSAKFGTWFNITRVIMAAYRAVTQMVDAVIELDTSMTELKKVTNETDAVYAKFLDNSTVRAKELGASLSDVVTASADFARLGYSIGDAEKLADAAIIYKNVGDGIEDINTASESIIATMQAFGIGAEDAMLIVDKFNEVGNNYAISSVGVGEALLRSAAAMQAANNTLDETIALATAANTIVQDPEKVGTTLKTVSMYLRAAKTEAEEAGESTEGMANSVSELRDEILALTGNKVDIQIDEDTFKSTYQILQELSQVWGELTDISQANILEMVGGKRNSNVVAALLENFSVAENALKTAATSAGSALSENDKYLESINGKISRFKAAFEEMSQNFIGSDFVKGVVDFGTTLIEILNGVGKVVEALGGLNTVLTTTIGIIAILKAKSLETMLLSLGKKIMGVGETIAIVGLEIKDAFAASRAAGVGRMKSAVNGLSAGFNTLTAAATTAQLAIAAFMIVLTALILVIQSVNKAQEKAEQKAAEVRQQNIQAAQAAATYSDELSTLINGFIELNDVVGVNNSNLEQFIQTRADLIEKLQLEEDELDTLIKKYGSYSDAVKQATVDKLRDQERDLRGGINSYEDEVIAAAKPEKLKHKPSSMPKNYKSNLVHIWSYALEEITDGDVIDQALSALQNDSRFKVSYGNNKVGSGLYTFQIAGMSESDLSDIDNVLKAYDLLGEALDVVEEKAGSNNQIYKDLYAQYSAVTEAINNYRGSIGNLNKNLAEQYMLDGLIGQEVPKTKEEFDAYKQSIIDSAKSNGEFIGTEKDISVAIDGVLSQQPQFMKFYADLIDETDNATDSTNKFVSVLSKIHELDTGLSELDKIYADIFDKGDFGWSSILDNEAFTNAFSGLGESYTDFMETVANSPTDINACQEAFNNLATAYILNSNCLKDVTDETRNATVAMLEQKGIANAAAIVDAQLAYNKEYLKYTTGDYANMTYEEILALYSECEAGSAAQQVLAEFAIAKKNINENGIQTSSDIDQVIALANAASATVETLNQLSRAKGWFSYADKVKGWAEKEYQTNGDSKNYQSLLRSAEHYRKIGELASKDIKFEYNTIDSNKFKVKYSGGSVTKSAKNSASKAAEKQAKESENWFQRQLKDHQHRVAMEQETEADYLTWLNGAYKKAYNERIIELDDYYKYQEEVYNGLRDLFRDHLNDVEHEISMRENYDKESKKIISLYNILIKNVEKEIKTARAQGLTDEDDYIQELQKKWQGYAESVKDIQEEATESAKDAVAELVDYRIDMIKQDIENEKDALDKKLDYLKEFYDKQKDMLQDQYDEEKYLEEQAEKRKSVSDLRSEIAMLENDDSAWAQKRKLELQEELATAEDDLGNFEDEHALDLALDALDNAYNAQEAQIQAEMDALEEKLNDPEALYNQALTEIKNNTGNLYQEMLEYNRKHGTGNDEDVKDIYEEAYKALLEYKDIYGKDYEGVVLTNSTNYKPETGSWDTEKISGTNPNNKPKEEPKKEKPKNTAPSLSKGSTITVKKSATHFGSKSNGVRMASFVPGGSYTVYQTSGNQVLIGRNGVYTGWINKSDIVGYAKGTKNATAGLHSLDELGSEYLFTSTDGNKYRVLSSGDKVLNARATDFLYEFANGGGEILEKIIKSVFGTSLFDSIKPAVVHNDITVGGVTVQGNADTKTVSEIRRAQRDNLTEMLKSLNKLNK